MTRLPEPTTSAERCPHLRPAGADRLLPPDLEVAGAYRSERTVGGKRRPSFREDRQVEGAYRSEWTDSAGRAAR